MQDRFYLPTRSPLVVEGEQQFQCESDRLTDAKESEADEAKSPVRIVCGPPPLASQAARRSPAASVGSQGQDHAKLALLPSRWMVRGELMCRHPAAMKEFLPQ
jgi:hypothetical protein